MGLIENIFGAVLLIGVVLAVTLIVTLETSENVTVDLAFKQQSFLQEKHQVSLNTVFALTEPETGQTYDRLVGRSLSNRREVIDVGQSQFNVTEELRNRFNLIYGEGNWYYEVTPRVTNLAIAFVIDGTTSVDEQREILQEEIEDIISRTNDAAQDVFEEVTLSYYMFISSEDESKCEVFNTLAVVGFEQCFTVSREQMYASLSDENGYPAPEFAVEDFGNLMYDETVAYEADWLGALVWGAQHISETAEDPSGTISLFFPMTDEMTTGSIPDQCYEANLGEATTPQDARANAIMCGFCHGDCPTRSEAQLDAAESILNDLYVDFSPPIIRSIFIEECDIAYNSALNQIETGTPRTQYVDESFGTERPSGDQTWCDLQGCPGCETHPTDNSLICFRSVCSEETEEQLRYLNDLYGEEEVITLTEIQDLPEIVVETVIQEINRQIREDGVLDETRNRFVVRYDLFVPGQEVIPFTLWVYEERGFDMALPEVFDTPIADIIETIPDFEIEEVVSVDRLAPGNDLTIRIPALEGVTVVQVEINERTYPLSRQGDYFVGTITLEGFEDGTYDIRLIFSDAQGNVHTQELQDVFEVDVDLAPLPEFESASTLRSRYSPGSDVTLTVQFSSEQPLQDVQAVVTIGNPTTQHVALQRLSGTQETWGATFNAPQQEGLYAVSSVLATDAYGRTLTFQQDLPEFEVSNLIECTQQGLDACMPGEYCWGNTPDELFCDTQPAPQGSYTHEDSACQQGLDRDPITNECYEPRETYDFVFVPLRFTNLQQYQSFVQASVDALYAITPIRECTSENIQQTFRIHVVEDLECAANNGCGPTGSIGDCLQATITCAQQHFPGIGDRYFGMSAYGWPVNGGTVLGQAADFGSQNMVTSRHYGDMRDIMVFLHEAGHTWYLGHLGRGVPPDGGPCRQDYPNVADCAVEEDRFIMNYRNIYPAEFGPAGYGVIRNSYLSQSLEACTT